MRAATELVSRPSVHAWYTPDSRLSEGCDWPPHVCLTIAVAFAFQTDLDSPYAPTFSADSADGAFIASQQYADDIEARKSNYDMLLVSTFVVLVPGCTNTNRSA